MHPNSDHIPVFPHPPFTPTGPPKENLKTVKPNQNKQAKNKPTKYKKHSSLLYLSYLSNISSFVLMALGVSVSHSIPFCPFRLTSKSYVHFNKSLVWLKLSGFRNTIISGSSPKLLSDSLLLPGVMEILWVSFHRTSPFTSDIGC